MAEYLKLPEVAQRLDVSEKTARRYVKAGVLPSVFIGGAYRVSERDLEEFLRKAKVEPGKASAPPSQLEPSLFNNGFEEERRTYPYSWMADALARTIQHWSRLVATPPENPNVSYAISVAALDALDAVLRFDVPGQRLKDRVPADEVEERAQVGERLLKLVERANAYYVESKEANQVQARSVEERRAEIRQRTEEIA